MTHIRYSLRQLGRRPGLSLVVILLLALGIGATTAMFSMFDQILVRPLPVAEPGRLVNLREPGRKEGAAGCSVSGPIGYEYCFSYPMFRDLEAKQTAFTDLAAHHGFQTNMTYGDQTQSGRGLLVSGGYFGALNLAPALGRLIGPLDEPRVGESAVVVLSHDYWRSRFGGDPNVVGEALTVNGQPLTVIGVAPAGFTGTSLGYRPLVFVPLTLRWLMTPTGTRDDNDRRSYWLHVFARLTPETTIEQASAVINTLHRGILDEVEAPLNTSIPNTEFQQRRLTLEPGARGEISYLVRDTARPLPLVLLLGITLVVLLIVCVNLANLLLARSASRAGEIAIYASLGATRRHLVMQLLSELGVLAAIGAALSLPVAAVTLRIVTTILPKAIADGLAVGLDPTPTLLAVAVSLITVFAFGLIPALRVARADPGLLIKGHASKSSGSARFRAGLVTGQIAFSMVLLVLAGLFAQSLANVARVDLGMETDSLLSFLVAPRLNGYNPDRMSAVYDRLEEALAAQPGVTSVSSARIPVIANSFGVLQVSPEDFELAPGASTASLYNVVGMGFFDTLSILLLVGRDFTAQDTSDSKRVAIVNESFLRKLNPGDDALGRRFSTPSTGEVEIIGVVADAKYASVKGETLAQFFVPRRQLDNFSANVSALYFYVRAAIEPDVLAQTIPGVVSNLDPNLPVDRLITMKRQLRENVYLDRLMAILSVGFAGLATLLVLIGLYSVLAYNVTQRTRELGLRLALGASPRRLRVMVLKHVGAMAVVGGAIGLAAAVGFGRAAETLLYGLSGYEPRVLFTAVAVLAVVVLAAGYIPARRASNVAPMEALRYE
jgi:predicted permease